MLFEISHSIKYSYSKQVFIEPMVIRLHPRHDPSQRVDKFIMNIEPLPASITQYIDQDCNNISTVWFNGLHNSLSITASSLVEVTRVNPFNFIITEDEASKIPVTYSKYDRLILEPYRKCRYNSLEINKFMNSVVEESGEETITFLVKLASRITEDFQKVKRERGNPLTPDKTIARRKGACRDLAVLYMEVCRLVGLATRFVSGYCQYEESSENDDMHAWAEVYLPGGGWCGFDPTIGLAIAEGHVAVATAADAANASSTSGAFRGTGVKAELLYDISIHSINSSVTP
jgi:transglutaminase-like putative cysteine protease